MILDHVIAAWGAPCRAIALAKFHTPLGPDQPVEVHFEPARDADQVRFSCWRGTDLICSGLILVAPVQ